MGYDGVGVGMVQWGIWVGKGRVAQEVGIYSDGVKVGVRVEGGLGLIQGWLGRGRREPGFGPTPPLP